MVIAAAVAVLAVGDIRALDVPEPVAVIDRVVLDDAGTGGRAAREKNRASMLDPP